MHTTKSRAQSKSCCCSGIVWQRSKNLGWVDSDLYIIPWFWELNGKCQGWSRSRGQHEWANCDLTGTGQTDGVARRKKKKYNRQVIRARRPTLQGEDGRESSWWEVVVHHSPQISHPGNIFKYNRNSNKQQSPNGRNCYYTDLSLYQLFGWNPSQRHWRRLKCCETKQRQGKITQLDTEQILAFSRRL